MSNPTSALDVENWFTTTLSTSCGPADTTIYVNNLPTPAEGYLILDAGNSGLNEVIHYTSKTSNAVVLTNTSDRGLDGTTAQPHASNAAVALEFTSAYWDALKLGYAIPSGTFGPQVFSNPYKFSAYLSTSTNFTNGSWGATVFNVEEYDTGSNYSVSTGKFTAPVAGFYDFTAGLSHNNAGSDSAGIALYKNGSVCKQGGIVTSPNASVVASVKNLQLAAGDYIQVYNSTSTAGLAITANESQAYFMGGLASKT